MSDRAQALIRALNEEPESRAKTLIASIESPAARQDAHTSGIQRGFFSCVGESLSRGNYQTANNVALFKALVSMDASGVQIALERRKRLQEKTGLDPIEKGHLTRILYGWAGQIPRIGYAAVYAGAGALAGGSGAAAGAMILGQVPPFTFLGEEAATVPISAVTAGALGAKMGATYYFYMDSVGELYATALENGAKPGVAAAVAAVVGLPYALLEEWQLEILTPDLKQKVMERGTKIVMRLLGRAVKQWGADLGMNTIQEVAQEAVNMVSDDTARFLSGKDVDLSAEALKERGKRLVTTGIYSLESMAALPGPGVAVETARTRVAAAAPAQGAAEAPAVTPAAAEAPTAAALTVPPAAPVEGAAQARPVEAPAAAPEAITAAKAPEAVEAPQAPPARAEAPTEAPKPLLATRPAQALAAKHGVNLAEVEPVHGEADQLVARDVQDYLKMQELVQELGIDLAKVEPLHGAGRVRLADVQEYVAVQTRLAPVMSPDEIRIARRDIAMLRQEADAVREAKGERVGTRAEIKAFQTHLQEFIKTRLPLAERGRLLTPLRNANTWKQLVGGLRRTIDVVNDHEKRVAVHDLKETVQRTQGRLNDFRREYRQTLAAVLDTLQISKPTEAMRRKLESRAAYLERGGEGLPAKSVAALARLTQKPIADMTMPEIRSTQELIETLVAHERLKRNLLSAQRQRAASEQAQEIAAGLMPVEEVPKTEKPLGRLGDAKRGFAWLAEKAKAWDWGVTRPGRLFRRLARFSDAVQRYIEHPIFDAVTQSKEAVDNHQTAFETKLQSLGIGLEDLFRNPRVVKPGGLHGVRLNPSEIIQVYVSSHDEGHASHLLGAGFTEADVQNIIADMTETERAVGDWLLEWYGAQYEGLAQTFFETTGRELPRTTGWSSVVIDKEYLDSSKDIADELLERQVNEARRQVEHGMTKERVGGTQPIRLCAVSNFRYNAGRYEHYKAFAVPVQNIWAILEAEDSLVRRAVTAAGSEAQWNELRGWFETTARIGPRKAIGDGARVLDWLTRNQAPALIGFNVLSSARAFLSFFNSVGWRGDWRNLPYHVKAMVEMTRHPIETWNRAREILPELKHRFAESALESFYRQVRAGRYQGRAGTLGKIQKISTDLYQIIDGVTVSMAAVAHYDKFRADGLTHEDAKRLSAQMIHETQPMAGTAFVPGLWRDDAIWRALALFQNQINQQWNVLRHDIPMEFRERGPGLKGLGAATGRAAWIYWWSMLVPMYLLSIIARARIPDEDELAEDMALYHIGLIWPLGSVFMAGWKGYSYMAPPFQAISDLGRGAQDARHGRIAQAFRKTALGICKVFGVPVTQVDRTIDGVLDMIESGETDPRRLIWSEGALKEKEEAEGRAPARSR